jgi:hypothetical protein
MKEHLKPRLLYVYCMWSEEDLHTCILKEQIKKEIKLHEGVATVGSMLTLAENSHPCTSWCCCQSWHPLPQLLQLEGLLAV